MADAERKTIATHRRARFEYELFDHFEAGLVLSGPEVKSLRAGKASLQESYALIRRGEGVLVNAYIAPYEQAGRENPPPRRDRKLLLHKAEIARLQGRVAERGFLLVPTALYFKNGRAKVEIAVARKKRRHDKRETIRRRMQEREMDRAVRGRGRGRA